MSDTKSSRGVAIDLRVGQSLQIGDAVLTLEQKSGQLARLRLVAKDDIVIRRQPLNAVAQ